MIPKVKADYVGLANQGKALYEANIQARRAT